MATTAQLRELLPGTPNGAPNDPGWYVVERIVFAGELLCVVHVDTEGRIHCGDVRIKSKWLKKEDPSERQPL